MCLVPLLVFSVCSLHACIHKSSQSMRYYSQLVKLRQDDEEREELGEDDDDWPDGED